MAPPTRVLIIDWCRRELGSAPRRLLFSGGHLSRVLGLGLDDGRQVVVKLRQPDARIHDALAVQSRLFDIGFPCPQPLSGVSAVAGYLITAEAWAPADPPGAEIPPAACATLLAELVGLAGDASGYRSLAEPLPWVDWGHGGPGRWPPPDDLDADLNDPPGPAWLEAAAERIAVRLAADEGRLVVGHCDWEAHNIGWDGPHAVMVYDWDSLCTRTEPALAGAASAVFPSAPGGRVAATLAESDAFLHAYNRLRAGWDAAAVEIAWAAGLWVLLYNARKEIARSRGTGATPPPADPASGDSGTAPPELGSSYVAHLKGELETRLRLAGA